MSFDNFEEYKKQGEPDQKQKAENWGIAIGLQAVDGLRPSKYLIEIAKDNIEGKITTQEVQAKLSKYYETDEGKDLEQETKEADVVSARINDLLSNSAFTFAPATLFAIHDYLFSSVYPLIAGNIRKVNITKDEEVLSGDTVQYGADIMIKQNLDAAFDKEQNFDYSSLDEKAKVSRIAEFTSQIWQIHPFREGNTRAVAVFIIKYLRTLGFDADNALFDLHSKYFRDALVRANYQNLKTNVFKSYIYLDKFFDNLLLGCNHELDNEDLKIGKITDIKSEITDKFTDILSKPELSFLKMVETYLQTEEFIDNAQAQILSDKSAESVKKYFAKLVKVGALTAVGENKGRKYKLNN